MSEKHQNPGPDPSAGAEKAQGEAEAARAKQEAARAKAEAKEAQRTAEAEEEKHKSHPGKPAEHEAKDEDEPKAPEEAKPSKEAEDEPEAKAEETEAKPKPIKPKQKPELDDETKAMFELRNEKQRQRPAFRRQEWFRYKKLGGKHAGWRSPKGMHSKMRMHLNYRPNVASIGYRGPAVARGLHPSGFQEVLVHRPEDLADLDGKIQAARVGGTVGGRKAELIEKKADELGIRVLNRRS